MKEEISMELLKESDMEKNRPNIKMGPIVMDCGMGGAKVLSEFYSRLLGWNLSHPAQNGTSAITSPQGNVMAFQEVEGYESPVWPWKAGKQGQMIHFDLEVEDLEEAISYAVLCGARLAEEIFFEDSRTLFDPAGHPFCLDTYRED
ncbi:MAG: hypothetical protein RHS_1470 [Robinsoniella sp. RHS]|nr:MAG: hypothetical protein RHS_1470 [Robinsoniella sp. RHS]